MKILDSQTQYCHGISQLFLPPRWHVGWQQIYTHCSLICHPIRGFCHSIFFGRSQVQYSNLFPGHINCGSVIAFCHSDSHQQCTYLPFATGTALYSENFDHPPYCIPHCISLLQIQHLLRRRCALAVVMWTRRDVHVHLVLLLELVY